MHYEKIAQLLPLHTSQKFPEDVLFAKILWNQSWRGFDEFCGGYCGKLELTVVDSLVFNRTNETQQGRIRWWHNYQSKPKEQNN